MAMSYLEAAQKLADAKGVSLRELFRTHSREEIVAELERRFRFRFATFSIDPAILEAGDVVAADRGVPRKQVFRTMDTADVLAEAERIREGG